MRQARLVAVAAGLVVGLSAGCGFTGADQPGPVTESPSGVPAPVTSPEGSTPPGEVVHVDRESRGVRVRFDVLPVETDGDLAVLRYDFTATPVDPAATLYFSEIGMSLSGLGGPSEDGRGVRLFDTAEGLVHPVAKTPDGYPAAMIAETDSDDEVQRGSAVAVFAAPESTSVDVLLPGYGTVTVPAVEGGDDFQQAVDQVGGVSEAETKDLRAFSHTYDTESATSAEDGEVTVTLASDVLFASDQHTLSKKARRVVDRAAASITTQADAGEVHVVGHTDDVDTDAYNQALSERRAKSVADRLGATLGGDIVVTEEGRGESEPVAEGTSAEDRRANRRVEIHFRGHLVVESEAESDVPETDAPTAENDAVTIGTDHGRYRIEVESMVRRPGAIVGTLVAERTAGTSPDGAWFLSSYRNQIGDRKFGVEAELAGPHNLSLLNPQERFLPFDYVQEKSDGYVRRRLLGDEEVKPLDQDESTLITLVWPDTGQDTVTIDAPDRFRITDVPVADAPTGD